VTVAVQVHGACELHHKGVPLEEISRGLVRVPQYSGSTGSSFRPVNQTGVVAMDELFTSGPKP
jgi:hypothetical protein